MLFDDYVDQNGQALLRAAYLLTGDPHRAEDLTQTVLADAYRHWSKVVAAKNPDAYVRGMLVNAHLSWHRRRSSTERPASLDVSESLQVADPAEQIASREHFKQALSGLAPRARTVIVLRYYADLDDNAIAEAMGLTVSAVRATASRALATLRRNSAADTTTKEPR